MDAGLFGGTFNPLHNGHIGIVRYVRTICRLDRIFLYPAATPPHKPPDNLAPARDRLQMVKDCVKTVPGLYASDIELKRKGPSFTIDTIQAFKKAHGSHINFFLLMGSDAFFDIPTWKAGQDIFKTVPVIVMIRGEIRQTAPIISFVDEQISKGYTWDKAANQLTHEQLKPIRICNVPRIDISSTMIRERIKNHQPISGLVPENVETLIKTKDLYQ